MKLKRAAAMLCAILIAAGALSGCGNGNESSSSTADKSSSQSSGSSVSETSKEDTKDDKTSSEASLRFLWWGADARHEATIEVIDKYMENNPGITIEGEYAGWDGYREKLSTQLAGGTAPDIMQIDQPWLGEFNTMGDGFFADLNEYSDFINMDGFDQKFLGDFTTLDGKLLGLPTGLNALNFLVNQDALEKSGIEIDGTWDWDQFHEKGKTVNEANPESYFFNMDAAGVGFFIGKIYYYQKYNKPLINDDYTIAATKEELTDTFTYIQKLYDDKVIIPVEESMLFNGAPQDNPKWADGQTISWFNWASTIPTCPFLDTAAVYPYPIDKDAKQSSYIVRPAQVFSLSDKGENKEESAKFMDYMFNDPEAIEILKDVRSIPATEEARKLCADKDLVNPLAVEAVDLALADQGSPENILSNNPEILSAYDSAIEKLAYNQGTPEEIAEETLKLWEDIAANLQATRD